jgi:ABC-2 type transport system permease protein
VTDPSAVSSAVSSAVAPARAQRGLGAAIRDSSLIYGRNVKLFRNPASMLGMTVFPLIFLLGFTLVLTRSLDRIGIDAAPFLTPTVVVQAMFFAAMSSAFYLAQDRTTGLVGRLRTLPIHPAAPVLGRLAADVTRSAISLTVLVACASVLGFRFRAGPVAAAGFVLVGLLFSLAVAAGYVAWVLAASDPTAATQVMSVPYLPLLMLSTGFAAVEGFPGWLQPFVRWQPVSLTVDALRVLAEGGPTAMPVAKATVVLGTVVVVFVTVATRSFRRLA